MICRVNDILEEGPGSSSTAPQINQENMIRMEDMTVGGDEEISTMV
jgi:hypothetical protein